MVGIGSNWPRSSYVRMTLKMRFFKVDHMKRGTGTCFDMHPIHLSIIAAAHLPYEYSVLY